MKFIKFTSPLILMVIALLLARAERHFVQPAPVSSVPEILIPIEVVYEDAGCMEADAGLDETKVLGSYETKYKIKGEGARAANIYTAATRVITNLEPGAEFSFNDAVGPRTEDNGFLLAPTIFDGEIRPGIGGGVCQVSSTIYAAALAAELEVVSRQPHSRVSKYIPAGLDATVSYPAECDGDHRKNTENKQNPNCYSIDLVIKNTYPFVVGLRTASVALEDGSSALRVMFVGADSNFQTNYVWYSANTDDFEREIKQVKSKPADYKKQTQKGKPGLRVVSTFEYKHPDGVTRIKWKSLYLPVNETWEVGPGWDLNGPAPWESEN